MNKRYFKRLLLAATALVFAVSVRAEVRLPNLFSSHMVLQRDTPVEIGDGPTKENPSKFYLQTKKSKQKPMHKDVGRPNCQLALPGAHILSWSKAKQTPLPWTIF
jgi:hypothetical protein